jgi:orotate phosphoribosyltransferase
MNSGYYSLSPGRDVTAATVLVVDDTWTSGVSMASVGYCLRQAGAAAVVGLPLGRQVGSNDYGTTRALRDQILEREWTLSTCVLCG